MYLNKMLEFVDWDRLDEGELPEKIEAYISDDFRIFHGAYTYFDNRLESKVARPEEYGALNEILRKEGLVFAVPILIHILSFDNINSKKYIIDNLIEIASNIIDKIDEAKEPYYSRANKILESLKIGTPIYVNLLNKYDNSINEKVIYLLKILYVTLK